MRLAGYCHLCHLRIEGPAAPLGTPEAMKAEAERASLGLLVISHIRREHPEKFQELVVHLSRFQALVGLYCLDPVPVTTEPKPSFDLEASRARLLFDMSLWLTAFASCGRDIMASVMAVPPS